MACRELPDVVRAALALRYHGHLVQVARDILPQQLRVTEDVVERRPELMPQLAQDFTLGSATGALAPIVMPRRRLHGLGAPGRG